MAKFKQWVVTCDACGEVSQVESIKAAKLEGYRFTRDADLCPPCAVWGDWGSTSSKEASGV